MFEGPIKIYIDQNKDRFYYLIVEHAHGKLNLEKHPVLSTARDRLGELKHIFD